MELESTQLVRKIFMALVNVCTVALVACSHDASAPPPPAPPNPSVVADMTAFDKNPNPATWAALHADIVTQPPNTYEANVIRTLSSGRVPKDIITDAVVDLAALDWGGAMKWIRNVNLGARSGMNTTTVRGSARLAWMMFTMRSSWATDFVDLTRMDLRATSPYLASQVNLNNVDFAQTQITGSTWVGVSLLNASFDGAVIDGPLNCTACSWGSAIMPGTVTLRYGKWVAR
jgi:hypothetical protein